MNQKKSITKPKNLRKRRLQNGDHWYKSAGENKKIEVRTEICWVLCYIKVSLSKSFLLCMYFYKGFFKKTQITGSIEKISSMGKMRQTRYLRLITQMSLKKVHNYSKYIPIVKIEEHFKSLQKVRFLTKYFLRPGLCLLRYYSKNQKGKLKRY